MKPVNSIGLIWKGFWQSWHSSLFVQIIFPTQCQRSARKMPFLVARPRFVSFRSGWTLAWKWIQRTMQKMKNGLKIWKFIMKLILLASGGCHHQYNAMLCIQPSVGWQELVAVPQTDNLQIGSHSQIGLEFAPDLFSIARPWQLRAIVQKSHKTSKKILNELLSNMEQFCVL